MRVGLLGAGRMGSWLAELLSRQNEVAVWDNDAGKGNDIAGVERLEILADLAEFDPDLLLNSVSLQNTLPAFEAALEHISRECILGDIASVKGDLARFYGRSGHSFVSIHPMFGPTLGDLSELNGENLVIIKGSHPETAGLFRNLFKELGLNIYDYNFDEHDRMMAYSLATPFVGTLTFAACVDDTAVPGTTFARHMDIARSLLREDHELLTEILFSPQALEQIENITSRLEFLKHIIRQRDREEAGKFLAGLEDNVGLPPKESV